MSTPKLPFACFFSERVTLPSPAPHSYVLGTGQGGRRIMMGIKRVWKARTRPGNSKINLLILSRLRVSDSVLRERLLGAGLWPETAHSLRTENLSVLFRVDRKPVGLPPPFYQPPPPASTLTGLSLEGQIREKDPTGSPSDPVLQLQVRGVNCARGIPQ